MDGREVKPVLLDPLRMIVRGIGLSSTRWYLMECLLVHLCDQGSTPSPDSGVFFENTLIVFEPGLG